MTDWIEHTTDTCPVDPDTVVEVRYRGAPIARRDEARFMGWHRGSITHYRIITPAKPPEPEMVKPDWIEVDLGDGRKGRYRVTAFGPNGPVPATEAAPEPEVTFKYPLLEDPEPEEDEAYLEEAQRQADREFSAYKRGFEAGRASPEPDFVNLRLECLKLAVNDHFYGAGEPDYEKVADRLLRYVLNGSVDKA